jgi:hypothetical protein
METIRITLLKEGEMTTNHELKEVPMCCLVKEGGDTYYLGVASLWKECFNQEISSKEQMYDVMKKNFPYKGDVWDGVYTTCSDQVFRWLNGQSYRFEVRNILW